MTMIAMAPDSVDINEVLAPTLKRCPFCGSWPLTFSRINETRSIYQAHIKCNSHECDAAIFCNDHSLEEARAGARARWERRSEPVSAGKAAPGGSA